MRAIENRKNTNNSGVLNPCARAENTKSDDIYSFT